MNKKITILISSLVIIAVLAVVSFWVVKSVGNRWQVVNKNQNTNQNVNTDQNDNQPDNGEIDTSDWLTYNNEEYGYSIKYPKGWTMREFPGTKTGAEFNGGNDKIAIDDRASYIGPSNDPFDKYIQNLENSAYKVSDHPFNSKEEFITITGIKGYIINWNESMKDYGMDSVNYDTAYFEAKKQGFYKDRKIITVHYSTIPTEYSTKIFNAMIETFDYID